MKRNIPPQDDEEHNTIQVDASEANIEPKKSFICFQKLKIWIYLRMPILEWLPRYNVERDFKFDLVAGVTVAFMLIPQSVSLASIIGVKPIYCLYTACITPLIYPIFVRVITNIVVFVPTLTKFL